MNLGEFIIKIGTQGDTKALDEAIKKMSEAEKKTRRRIKLMRDLAKATSDEEKELIKKNAAQQDELEGLKDVKLQHEALNNSIQKNISTAFKFIGAIGATAIALDRMGNSLLKSNQMYITFEKQTDISIGRLSRMAGLARLGGMNLSPEQVAGDITSLQEKIFGFERLGENAETFGMLGINPRGMKSDQLITALRTALKGRSGQEKSFYLSKLGLSQEWLNVLDLTDEKYKEYLKTANELQLTEKERKQLAEYTATQQKNNMRWELAKQKLLISVMPLVQQIMEATSKIALNITKTMDKYPKWIDALRDIVLIIAGGTVLKTITAFSKLLTMGSGLLKTLAPLLGLVGINADKTAGKGFLGGLLGKSAGGALQRVASRKGLGAALGLVGKRMMTGAAGFLGGPVVGAIFTAVSAILIIKDLFEIFMHKKDEEDEELTPDPDSQTTRYNYQNVRSNMTNNFFNNPVPAKEAIQQLSEVKDLLIAEQWR